jgi:AcrR family transcriptional regulator
MRTAIGLMADQGFDGTSIRDIASAAGVSVAALYHHFPSKLDLLRQFLHEAHDVVLVRLERALIDAEPDPRSRLDAAVDTLVWSNLHDDWAARAARVAWRDHGRLDEPDQAAIAVKVAAMVDLIAGVVAEGAARGEFRTDEPGDVARAVFTLCTAVSDPLPARRRSLARTIEQHQRFAAALADTGPRPATTPPRRRGR